MNLNIDNYLVFLILISVDQMSGKIAVLLGGSGETGKSLMSQLIHSPVYTKVISLGRREIPLPVEDKQQKVSQEVIDFDNLESSRSKFRDADSAFICLGTTRAKAGAEGFVKVDHDYVLAAATILKEEGCSDLHLLTSTGSNPDSWLLYPETKGRVEENVAKLNFDHLSIYRPRLLMADRGPNRRLFEHAAQWAARVLDPWRWWSVSVERVAEAMLVNSLREGRGAKEVLEHNSILQITATKDANRDSTKEEM